MGGDEFVVLLPLTPLIPAQVVANRIKESVSGIEGATVSIGLAQLGPDDTLDELLIAADRAMYEAKRTGGNRFAILAEVKSASELVGS